MARREQEHVQLVVDAQIRGSGNEAVAGGYDGQPQVPGGCKADEVGPVAMTMDEIEPACPQARDSLANIPERIEILEAARVHVNRVVGDPGRVKAFEKVIPLRSRPRV